MVVYRVGTELFYLKTIVDRTDQLDPLEKRDADIRDEEVSHRHDTDLEREAYRQLAEVVFDPPTMDPTTAMPLTSDRSTKGMNCSQLMVANSVPTPKTTSMTAATCLISYWDDSLPP